MKQADIIISGGGMVGLTLGLALAQGGTASASLGSLFAPATMIFAARQCG